MAKRQRPNPVEELPKEQMAQLESNVYDHIETLFSEETSNQTNPDNTTTTDTSHEKPKRRLSDLLSEWFATSWIRPASIAFAAIAFVAVGAITLQLTKHSATESFFDIPESLAAADLERHIEVPQQNSRALAAEPSSERRNAFLAGVISADLDLTKDTQSSITDDLLIWYQRTTNNDQTADSSEAIKSVQSSITHYSSNEQTSGWLSEGYAVELVHLAAKRTMTDMDFSVLQSALGFYRNQTKKPWTQDSSSDLAKQYIQNHDLLINTDSNNISTPEQVQEIITSTNNMKILVQ